MQAGSTSIQSGFTLLSALEESDLDWIFATGREEPAPTGAVVVQEGVRGEFIYFVLEGLLSVSSAALGRREIARLGPGQIFGEMSFLEDRPTSATISAVEDSLVLAVARADLESKLAADSALAARIYKALAIIAAGRLRELVGTLARWMEVEERVSIVSPMLERWQEIAARTQHLKQLIVRVEKDAAADVDLSAELAQFSGFMNAAIGADSPETVDAREELGARIQREILPYFLKSRTVEWLYKKPHGYAADYEALEMIAAHQPQGSGAAGALLDRAFLSLPAIRAVRDRKQSVTAALTRLLSEAKKPLRVAGIGCGAAEPLLDLLGSSAGEPAIEATAVDFDMRAIEAARSRLPVLGLTDRFRLLNTNIVHLASGRDELDVQDQDIIYGFNIADYLDNRLLLRFLNQAFRKLRPGGQLLLSAFHRGNPDHAFLDHVIDWKATHWSEEEINALFVQSNFKSPALSFVRDPDKITFIAVCQRSR